MRNPELYSEDMKETVDPHCDICKNNISEKDGELSWYGVSNIVSLIMHPLIMPVYIVMFLLFGDNVISLVPWRTKIFIVFMVLLNTTIIPLLFIGFLRMSGYLYNLSERGKRCLPLIVAAICYALGAYMVTDSIFVIFIRKLLVAASVYSFAALAVTCYFKISLHMVAAGGTIAVLLILNMSWFSLGAMLAPFIVMVMLSGALASARLYLGVNTPGQVGAGLLLGLVVTPAALLLL